MLARYAARSASARCASSAAHLARGVAAAVSGHQGGDWPLRVHGPQRADVAAWGKFRCKSSQARPQVQADDEHGNGEKMAVLMKPAVPAASVHAAAPPAHSSAVAAAEAAVSAGPGARELGGGGSDTATGLQGLDGVGLSDRMRERLSLCGITGLFPVQRATFAALMNGKDMLVKARTGSGKTIGFALPIIEKIMAARGGEPRGMRGRAPASLILAPTRELAMQIQREFLRIDRAVTATCVYGGAPSGPQERALREGVDVVVGTPGRVIDMLERGALRMEEVKVFVLDEADEMLKMGFQEDVERIMQELPETKQMNLWSATQPHWITQTARKYCKNLETMDMVGSNPVRTADTIRHLAAACSWEYQCTILANIVRAHANHKRTLVFCNTKMDVDAIAASPELKGMARVIHGDINQQQRERTLADFRAGLFNVLVATDVAARGIDVPEVALVVQTKVPDDEDTFVHRSGRTGRAGREGINVVLYRAGEEAKLLQLAKTIGITFALEGSPTDSQMMQSRKVELMGVLDKVPAQSIDAFKDVAMEMHETRGWQAMAAALASLAGFSDSGPRSYSMLAGRPDFVTVQVELSSHAARNMRGIPGLRNLLQTAYPEGEFVALGKVVTLQDGATVLFDMPSREFAKLAPKTAGSDDEQKILSKSEPGVVMFAAKKLPSLKELVSALQSDGSGGRRAGGGRGGGGHHGGSGYNGYNGGQRQRDHGRGGGGGYGGGFVDRGRPRSGGGGASSDSGGRDFGRGRRGGSWSGGGGDAMSGQDEWGSKKSGFGGRRGDRPPRPSEWGR